MSSTISAAQASSTQVHGHRHHRRDSGSVSQADPFASTPAASGPGSTPVANGTPPAAGLQKFASELQSILLSAQSGTPANAAAGTSPTASGQSGPIRDMADRLQDLLGNGTDAATPSSAGGSKDSLESVLNTLQQTLQHRLASYGSQATASSSTSLTA